jgi:hypothetical protein
VGKFNENQIVDALDVLVDSCDLGSSAASAHLKMYDATGGVPARVTDAITTQVLLADLAMANPAFDDAALATPGATAAADTITDDSDANATGTAAFFRIVDRNGVARIQGTISDTDGSGELKLNSVALVQHARVQVSSLVARMPESV